MKILLVDDHIWIHDSAGQLLRQQGYEVLGAYSGEEAIELVEKHEPDVVLMDVTMPKARLDGIEACREIRDRRGPPVIIFTASAEYRDWWKPYAQAVLAGAVGFVQKGADPEELLRAVRLAGDRRRLFDPQQVAEAMEKWEEVSRKRRRWRKLTRRERQVLALIRKGMTNREIAEELVISVGTARNHVEHILDKLDVSGRVEAAAFEAD